MIWYVIGSYSTNPDELFYVGKINSLSETLQEHTKSLAATMCHRNGLLLVELRETMPDMED